MRVEKQKVKENTLQNMSVGNLGEVTWSPRNGSDHLWRSGRVFIKWGVTLSQKLARSSYRIVKFIKAADDNRHFSRAEAHAEGVTQRVRPYRGSLHPAVSPSRPEPEPRFYTWCVLPETASRDMCYGLIDSISPNVSSSWVVSTKMCNNVLADR